MDNAEIPMEEAKIAWESSVQFLEEKEAFCHLKRKQINDEHQRGIEYYTRHKPKLAEMMRETDPEIAGPEFDAYEVWP